MELNLSREDAAFRDEVRSFIAENAFCGFQNWEIDVRPDVEDADFQGRVLVRIVEEGDDFVFLASVERACVNLSAGSLDIPDERSQFFAVTTAGEDREAFCGEFFGDLAADEVSGADDGHGCVSLLQDVLPVS